MENRFTRLNNITGWLVFLIAALLYIFTVEPTVSFWDCGEYIASAFKLEVGHPPGAPLFLLLGRFFSLFASDVSEAARWINYVSVFSSAFTILFLFWTITHLGRKIIGGEKEMSKPQLIMIIGSGVIGALAYTFSDTFWFSAVEGEVYAFSSLFTAVVFWAILKWENVAHEPGSNRWIILIAYLMGLSVGVHLLNLLAIPAIVFVYYYKKYTVTRRGLIYASLVALVLLGTVVYVIIPGVVSLAVKFELFFVNTFGLPYSSGVIIYLLLLSGGLIAGLYYSQIRKRVLANTILLSVTVILIGYSSYTVILIRSAANPPMDENNPENVFNLLYYLNREQYGDRPLVYGQYYNAPIDDFVDDKPRYAKEDGKYVLTHHTPAYVFNPEFETLFPRMWSSKQEHISVYEDWGKVKGRPVRVRNRAGEMETINKPSFGENLRFFFSYQVGHMYLRYFMWNFAGRQNDLQGHGDPLKGNWISGIKAFDNARLGSQDDMPHRYLNNKARNRLYFLPFLLGLAGLSIQFIRKRKDFWVVTLLFLFTGLAILVYLNQYPLQPRERDYAYAGSFYAFAIWIGLGVIFLYEHIRRWIPPLIGAAIVLLLTGTLVPLNMLIQNLDDHDRSGRYTARDIAFNYLNTCEPNAVLITNGDNDTFPLWYIQGVEGVRTDVRVVNMMLFNTDWYINQMRMKAYDSEPLPITIPEEKYRDGTNNQIFIRDIAGRPLPMSDVIEWLKSENPRTKLQTQGGELLDFIPTKTIVIPVDKEKVLASGLVAPELADRIVPSIEVTLTSSYLLKNQLMLLDMLASNDWERPIYFVSGGHNDAMGLERYFQLEGFAYRLVPIDSGNSDFILNFGRVNTERLQENLMEKFQWGNINTAGVFLDFTNIRTFSVIRIRNKFARLANALSAEERKEEAAEALDRVMELMPHDIIPFDFYINEIIKAYYTAGRNEKAVELLQEFMGYHRHDLDYYLGLKPENMQRVDYDVRVALQQFQETVRIAGEHESEEMGKQLEDEFNDYYMRYIERMSNIR